MDIQVLDIRYGDKYPISRYPISNISMQKLHYNFLSSLFNIALSIAITIPHNFTILNQKK